MAHISKATLTLLGRELTDWTLATISELFDDAGVTLGPVDASSAETSQRRRLMRQYLTSLDLDHNEDERKLIQVFDSVLRRLVERGEFGKESLQRFVRYLQRDGYSVDLAGPRVMTRQIALTDAALAVLPNASAIHEHLRRLSDNVDKDPRLAVSVAKDLIESTAKLVLRERKVTFTDQEDLPALVKKAQASLNLHSSSAMEQTPRDSKALKSILGALSQLAQGVTELRNAVGVGHGRESVPDWVRPRHARLAAGAAQVWCQLILETLEDPSAPWRAIAATTDDSEGE